MVILGALLLIKSFVHPCKAMTTQGVLLTGVLACVAIFTGSLGAKAGKFRDSVTVRSYLKWFALLVVLICLTIALNATVFHKGHKHHYRER